MGPILGPPSHAVWTPVSKRIVRNSMPIPLLSRRTFWSLSHHGLAPFLYISIIVLTCTISPALYYAGILRTRSVEKTRVLAVFRECKQGADRKKSILIVTK